MSKTYLQCYEKTTVTFQNGSSKCEPNVALSFTPKIVTCNESDVTSVAKHFASDKALQGAENNEIRRNHTSNNLTNELHETQYHSIRRSSSCSNLHTKK